MNHPFAAQAAPGDAALDAADAARARALLGCANLRDAAGGAPPAAAAASRDAWAEAVLAAALGGRGPGPAYVALGLLEAEHARGLLHAARRTGGPGAPPFSLRVLGRWDGTADGAAAAARGEDPLAPGAGLCGNQPRVWGVLTKLQNSLSRSNRSRFG